MVKLDEISVQKILINIFVFNPKFIFKNILLYLYINIILIKYYIGFR